LIIKFWKAQSYVDKRWMKENGQQTKNDKH